MRVITLDEAVKIINGTFAEAKRRDAYPLTAVLLDAGGRMKAAMKQDGASLLRSTTAGWPGRPKSQVVTVAPVPTYK